MSDAKLKILFVSSWYPNKYRLLNGIFVKRHAAANAIDCDVSAAFVCSSDSNLIEESTEDGIYTVRGYYKNPAIKLLKPIRYFRMWKKVLSVYKNKKGKPDLINANIVYPVSIIARWAKKNWGIPYVITEHCTYYFPEDGRYKGFITKLISGIGVVNASAVITVSHKLSNAMQSLGLKNKYFIIPNVVDTEVFTAKLSGSDKAKHFNFLHISSLDDEQKNVTGIVRVFKKFHVAQPFSKLTIIWDEDNKDSIDIIRRKEPFSETDGIFLEGKKMGVALASLFQDADAFILFSNYENLPVVMLEAFCCGVPVIATRVGDVPEYINNNNGILIDSKNEKALLEAMEKIYTNKGVYNPVEIRNSVVDKVSPAVISKQFTDIYKMVLKNKLNENE